MYSTRTRVHARIPNGHPREEKRAYRTKVRGQVGENRRACPAGSELKGPRASRQADCRAKTRAEVGEEVRVHPVEFKLNNQHTRRSVMYTN